MALTDIIAFTGHRPNKLGGYGPSAIQTWVRGRVRVELERLQPWSIIVGMAIGLDQWAAEEAYKLGIPYVAAVPFDGQEQQWPMASQEKYHLILSRAAFVVYVCEPGYAAWKMQARNEWMVDRCGRLIAAWDGTAGGTANCVNYAILQGLSFESGTIVRIDPLECPTC